MACESNSVSDERIGEALIQEVIEEELKHIPSEDVPSLTLPGVELSNELEDKLVYQLKPLVLKIGEKLKNDVEIQDTIKGIARNFECYTFKEMAKDVFEDGITWEKIAILFYIAGKLAVRMVEIHLPQSVTEILKWTVDVLKNDLLGWIRRRGGWICSFSELAVSSIETTSSMSSPRAALIITFFAGIALGSFITWRRTS